MHHLGFQQIDKGRSGIRSQRLRDWKIEYRYSWACFVICLSTNWSRTQVCNTMMAQLLKSWLPAHLAGSKLPCVMGHFSQRNPMF
jgi:hypothetical protein